MSEDWETKVEENLGRSLNDLMDVIDEYRDEGPDQRILMRLQGTLIRALYWANRLRLQNWAREREEREERRKRRSSRSRRKRSRREEDEEW